MNLCTMLCAREAAFRKPFPRIKAGTTDLIPSAQLSSKHVWDSGRCELSAFGGSLHTVCRPPPPSDARSVPQSGLVSHTVPDSRHY